LRAIMPDDLHCSMQPGKAAGLTDVAPDVREHGFAIVPSCLDDETLERLAAHFAAGKHALRTSGPC
jgi:hypothetical protein